MRVATLNVCGGTRGEGTEVDHQALLDACASLGADVLALQEVDRGRRRSHGVDQAAWLADRLGMTHVFAPARRRDGGEWGNALLVRGTIDRAQVLTLRGALRPGRRDQRSALVARAVVDGPAGAAPTTMSVAVAHLSLRVLDNVPQERAVLAALAARPGPRLLLGDLNRRTAWVRPAAAAFGLHLVDDDEPTAPRSNPRFRIDHAAVEGLRVVDRRVVDTGVSDHCALVVDLGP